MCYCMLTCSQARSPYLLTISHVLSTACLLAHKLAHFTSSHVLTACLYAHKLTHLTYSQAYMCPLHAYLLTSSLTLVLTHKLTGAHCMLTCSQAHSPYLLTSLHVSTACLIAHKLAHLIYSQAHTCLALHAYLLTSSHTSPYLLTS